MPAFQVIVPHALGQQQAVERLKAFLDRIAERYRDQVSKLEGSWAENILTFAMTTYGFTISGKLTVEEASARLDGQLPFAALAFRGKIEKSIGEEVAKALQS